MAAGAEPFVFLAWRPTTQWASDARARWIATLSFVYFTIQNDGGFGGVTQENASPLLGKQTILNLAEFHRSRAFGVVVGRVIDPSADGVAPHQLRIIRPQHFGRCLDIIHSRIEPQVIVVCPEDYGHSIMDR